MNTDTPASLSLSEAAEDPALVRQLADQWGEVLLTADGKPAYRLVRVAQQPDGGMTDAEKVCFAAGRVLGEYRKAFEELAK